MRLLSRDILVFLAFILTGCFSKFELNEKYGHLRPILDSTIQEKRPTWTRKEIQQLRILKGVWNCQNQTNNQVWPYSGLEKGHFLTVTFDEEKEELYLGQSPRACDFSSSGSFYEKAGKFYLSYGFEVSHSFSNSHYSYEISHLDNDSLCIKTQSALPFAQYQYRKFE